MCRARRKTREQLVDASSHVRYEMDMLLATACLLSKAPGRPKAVGYAFLEAFLVHARNLIEFFHQDKPNKKYPLDVRAFDYAPKWKTNDVKRLARRLYRSHHGEISKRMSHLTLKRTEIEQETWDYSSIRNDLRTLWSTFIGALPLGEGVFEEFARPLKIVPPFVAEGFGTSSAVFAYTSMWGFDREPADPYGETDCELA